MAMNPALLAAALKTAAASTPTDAAATAVWTAIATAIIAHITANAAIAVTGTCPGGAGGALTLGVGKIS